MRLVVLCTILVTLCYCDSISSIQKIDISNTLKEHPRDISICKDHIYIVTENKTNIYTLDGKFLTSYEMFNVRNITSITCNDTIIGLTNFMMVPKYHFITYNRDQHVILSGKYPREAKTAICTYRGNTTALMIKKRNEIVFIPDMININTINTHFKNIIYSSIGMTYGTKFYVLVDTMRLFTFTKDGIMINSFILKDMKYPVGLTSNNDKLYIVTADKYIYSYKV